MDNQYEVLHWRIGHAGCSEGPYPLDEVFEHLKERRWTGEIMVHARGRTDNWVPIESVPEFASILERLRGTYLGNPGETAWRERDDFAERTKGQEIWSPDVEKPKAYVEGSNVDDSSPGTLRALDVIEGIDAFL
jgi:hypothetical protein